MALLAESISTIVAVKIKERHDSFTDQYNRLFMVKMCVLSSALIGFNYFHDSVSCIIANNYGLGKSFVGSACWIQGSSLHKKWSFPLRISSINVTKSAGGNPEEILNGKLHLLCSNSFVLCEINHLNML